MLSKTIECLSMPLVVNRKKGFSLFHLFGVGPGSFQRVLACYGLFLVVSLFTSDNITECFDLQIYYKSTSCRFYYTGRQALYMTALKYHKVGQVLLQIVAAFLYYKVGQVVLQSDCYYKEEKALQSRETFITKWGRCCNNAGQLLLCPNL